MKCEILTFTTAGHLRLALNLAESLRVLGIDEWLTVVAGDDRSERVLTDYLGVADSAAHVRRRVPLEQPRAEAIEAAEWGTPAFSRLMVAKVEMLLERASPGASGGLPFLFVDADCSFVSNPFKGPHGLTAAQAEDPGALWVQSDRRDFGMVGVEDWDICSGVLFVQSVEHLAIFQATLAGLKRHLANVSVEEFEDEQASLNRACLYLNVHPRTLPPAVWLNGGRPWPGYLGQGKGTPDIILLHANWILGAELKERALRAAGAWEVSDALLRELSL